MLFNVYQKSLYKGLQIVQRAVSSKSTLPILTGIYLETKINKGLHLIANNLEIGIEYWVPADIKEEGAIVIPASQLINIIRELPTADIYFNADLNHYQLNLECLNSKFSIKGYQPDEFPQLPNVESAQKINISSNSLKKMIDEVKFSISLDQTQPSLTGGLMAIDGQNIRLVATNTYRLAYTKSNLTNNSEININVILPGNSLSELSHLITTEEEVKIILNNNYVRFNFNEIVLISRLIEGQFPNYLQVIPGECNTRIKIDRNKLLSAVKRVSLIARLDSNVIELSTNKDEINISNINLDAGIANESLEIELDGPEQKISIDASYLLDVLKVLDDEVINMELIGPLNPLTIKKEQNDDYIYLIMPVRPGL